MIASSAMVSPCVVLFSVPHSNARLVPLPPGPQRAAEGSPSSSSSSSHPLANASGIRFQHPGRDELSLSWWRRSARCRSNAAAVSVGGEGLQLTRAAEEEEEDEDGELCPVECVREFKTDEEFNRILDKAKESGALVVVDFYRTACGSCKYIEQGFAKLCKGSGNQEANVVFLKHNVVDEYDEQSEVAERLRIKAVPLFHFIKDGILLEAFPTRDKERILAAILKHTSS